MPTSRTGRSAEGFTLLELIVAVSLLSLFLALALPSLSSVGERRLNAEAKKVASIVRYLNDSSLTAKEEHTLSVDFAGRTLAYKGPEGEKSETFAYLAGIDIQSRGMVTDGQIILFFTPLGSREGFTVLLKDEKSSLSVVFNPLSGRVKIKPS